MFKNLLLVTRKGTVLYDHKNVSQMCAEEYALLKELDDMGIIALVVE